jgi:hypothetical protein
MVEIRADHQAGFIAGYSLIQGMTMSTRVMLYVAAIGVFAALPTVAQAKHKGPVTEQTQVNPAKFDGTWRGAWGGSAATVISINGGKVTSYTYKGTSVPIGQTTTSGNTLSFGSGYTVTLTLAAPNRATAQYTGSQGRSTASLIKS